MDQQLLAFLTVAEQRNFTRAAELLHTSQPSVSQHIRNLESRLGAKLFERTNKYVRLNKAGEIVYSRAKEILRQYELMNRLVDELSHEARGSLEIGASYTFGEYVLPRLLAKFCAAYPNIVPTVTIANSTEVIAQIRDGAIDIGIVEGSFVDGDDVAVETLAEDRLVIVASSEHPLRNGNPVSPSDLEQQRWIVREEGSGTREATDKAFARLGIAPRSMLAFGSTQAVKEAVEAGMGMTILSNWAIQKELRLASLSVIPVADSLDKRTFSVVTRKSEFQSKAVKLFHEALLPGVRDYA